MDIEILMPALSPTMEEGTLSEWFVKVGDKVTAGDLLAEIETDKATMELEATDEGIVKEIIYKAGTENIKINTPIAIIVESSDDTLGTNDNMIFEASEKTTGASNKVQNNKILEQVVIDNTSNKDVNQDFSPSNENSVKPLGTESARTIATPIAKRMASENSIDLNHIVGSGPKGRIIKIDIERAITKKTSDKDVEDSSKNSFLDTSEDTNFEKIPIDNVRKIIAARLTESKSSIPHFYLRAEIEIDNLLKIRSSINESLKEQEVNLTINDFVIKACAISLQQVPEANVIWAGDHIQKFSASNISVAVSIDGGLMTPILFNAETKTISALSNEMKKLIKKAKSKKLTPNEYSGGTFAISNLGMFGIDNFDAIINPPQSAILAVGQGFKRPKFNESKNKLEFLTTVKVTLSIDHRVIDGALGARLLNKIKDNLEKPEIMLA